MSYLADNIDCLSTGDIIYDSSDYGIYLGPAKDYGDIDCDDDYREFVAIWFRDEQLTDFMEVTMSDSIDGYHQFRKMPLYKQHRIRLFIKQHMDEIKHHEEQDTLYDFEMPIPKMKEGD